MENGCMESDVCVLKHVWTKAILDSCLIVMHAVCGAGSHSVWMLDSR